MFFSKLAKLMVLLPLVAHLYSCQKSSVTSQNQSGGGGAGGGETVDEVELELIGSVSEEDPGYLYEGSPSEVSGTLSLSAATGYQITVHAVNSQGQEPLVHEESLASSSFSVKFKAPKRYLILEVLRRVDSRKFKAVLPPPTGLTTASVHFDKTSTMASAIADRIRINAAAGEQSALAALSNQSLSVADLVKVAQSVRRTVDEQKSQNLGAPIDLSSVAESLVNKSNERFSSLQSSGLSVASIASKISETTYSTLFGVGAELIPPGVLAHRVDHDLGGATAATQDVAYEAIKSIVPQSIKPVEEAYRFEADAFRGAANLSNALIAEQQVAQNFTVKFNECISNPSACAASDYTPPTPFPNSPGASIPKGGERTLPVASTPESLLVNGIYTAAQAITLKSSTSGATIYYTTDGSTPSASSSLYVSPFLVQVSQTIKAIAVKSGYQNSNVGTFSYAITGTVQAASFSIAAGGYGPAQSVTLSSATPGAIIYYTTNGDTPTRSSTLYSGAITVSSSQTLKVFAVLDGWADSQVSSAQYTINGQVAAPALSIASGTYTSQQSLTLSTATSGALIYYTTNGNTPSASSTLYSGAISVGSSMTIKVIAVKSGYSNSNVSMGEYTLNIPLPLAATPSASQAAGTYTTSKTVTFSSATAGATIYYTTNDSVPTTSSSVYSAPILVQVSQTIKAIAVKSGYQNSGVGTFSYTITGTVQAPSFSVSTGGYGPAQSVTLSSATPGASIYYTTNGDVPSRSSSLYSGAITVSSSQTVKAFAVLEGWADSQASSAQYTINGQASAPTFSVTSGTYTSAQSVTLSSATSGALIYYTTNGDVPSASSTLYAGAISVGSSMTIKAIAIKAAFSNSSVIEAAYTINIPLPVAGAPAASPAAGTYTSAQSVSLSSGTSGATIYYTTDNSPPSTSSIVYSSPFLVQVSQTIKAIAVKSGYQNSGVGTFSYTITGT
ncbi:MAG: chitobiase/beta-hexosaminidase C-terminal domain-containing protein, partial [bacterium]